MPFGLHEPGHTDAPVLVAHSDVIADSQLASSARLL